MAGARAKMYVDEVLVGVFDSCNYAVNVGAEPIHILGRYGPADITPTSYEAVSASCSGFRIIEHGGHMLPKFPKLQDLLNLETVKLAIVDRQSKENIPILVIHGAIPVNYSTGYQARATSRIQITYLGVKATDESGDQNEINAAELL